MARHHEIYFGFGPPDFGISMETHGDMMNEKFMFMKAHGGFKEEQKNRVSSRTIICIKVN